MRAFASALGLTLVFFAPPGRSAENLANRILDAGRFERWNEVLHLADGFRVRQPSDLPALVQVINACVAVGCQRPTQAPVSEDLPGPALAEFIDAWSEFVGTNPAGGAKRFRALADDPKSAWLGLYGLISYAMEADNAELLRRVLPEAEAAASKPLPLVERIAAGKVSLAALEHRYAELKRLLDSAAKGIDASTRLAGYVNYFVWSDDLSAARQRIDKYIAALGLDHDAAKADIDLRLIVSPPTRLHAILDARLKEHPNYWSLRLVKAQLALERSGRNKAEEVILQFDAIPDRFAYVRLLRTNFFARELERAEFAEQMIRNLDELSAKYEDYPLFHVAAANVLIRAQKLSLAADRLDRAARQTPLYFPTNLTRAQLATALGDHAEAVRMYRRNLANSPKDAFAKLFLAQALVLAREFEEAARLIDEVRASSRRRYVPEQHIAAVEREIRASGVSRPRSN